MKYIVMPKDNPDTSGLPKDEVYKKLAGNVAKLVAEIQKKFPETKVEHAGVLGAVIEISEDTAQTIEKEFDCVIASDIEFTMSPFEFD